MTDRLPGTGQPLASQDQQGVTLSHFNGEEIASDACEGTLETTP